MAVSPTRRAKRAHRLASVTKRVSSLLDALAILDNLSALDPPSMRSRSTLVARVRRPFETYIKPMLQDHTFSMRFRMEYDDFRVLVDHLRPALQKNEKMGLLRNGAIPVEYQVAMTLRWLAGGSTYECMDGHVIARSTAYHAVCDAQYRIMAWMMNCPGSQNDRTAFNFSGFDKLLAGLPEGHFVVGDAAYGASERVVVPFPGTSLSASQDACNYYMSQCRMAIEQTYGILVSVVGMAKVVVEHVVNAVVRLHNFCRDRKVDVPTENTGSAIPPPEVAFDDDGLISSDYFETVPVRTGRPVKDQAKASKPREAIRKELEVAGLMRPEHNIARSHKRAS
ncbi:unnamed protein product [Ectocarpus sp. CCAP 1310/34]|nr:unnamed protein product [Ectocarpus sp. CCAP 1310/34]